MSSKYFEYFSSKYRKTLKDFFRWLGAVTLQYMVGSDRNLKSSKTLQLSLLPARMKKIQSTRGPNGPVNAHLISEPSISINHTKPD